jgi:hypothetical protein
MWFITSRVRSFSNKFLNDISLTTTYACSSGQSCNTSFTGFTATALRVSSTVTNGMSCNASKLDAIDSENTLRIVCMPSILASTFIVLPGAASIAFRHAIRCGDRLMVTSYY